MGIRWAGMERELGNGLLALCLLGCLPAGLAHGGRPNCCTCSLRSSPRDRQRSGLVAWNPGAGRLSSPTSPLPLCLSALCFQGQGSIYVNTVGCWVLDSARVKSFSSSWGSGQVQHGRPLSGGGVSAPPSLPPSRPVGGGSLAGAPCEPGGWAGTPLALHKCTRAWRHRPDPRGQGAGGGPGVTGAGSPGQGASVCWSPAPLPATQDRALLAQHQQFKQVRAPGSLPSCPTHGVLV